MEEKLQGFETVHMVTDYWDQPREGVADYKGRPHHYVCLFDDQKDEWSNLYLLKPLDAETFRLFIEDRDIWLRWKIAQEEGRTDMKTHPALPEDRERHSEIETILADRLNLKGDAGVKAEGEFKIRAPERCDGRTSSTDLKWIVRWQVV